MPSNLKVIQSHNFSGGMSSDIAPEILSPDQYRYMLNCNVLSTSEGNVGILTNVKGTVEIPVPLPDGTNKAIGWGDDEETNNLYFAVYNSLGYHGWYRYNSIDNAVIKIMECITDTGGTDIFGWSDRDRILHINIIENNLLYWTVISENEHPARKINISKALDRTPTGYNGVIKEDYTRAYKKTAPYPPRGKYFTDTTKEFNRVYGRLFKFAVRFGYDDKEWSNWSSFSDVAVPDFERYSGALSIPSENNGIEVTFDTGGFLVTKIEVAVMSTNPDGGTTPWVSIEVLEKSKLGIADNSEYIYKFYNDVSTSAIGDQQKVYRLYSYLPKDPKCQEFTDNALLYANFHEGFPVVPVDVDTSVRYDDIFIDDSEENELNDPSIDLINISYDYVQHKTSLFTVDKFKAIEATLVIGSDVKKGNLFTFILYDSKKSPRYLISVTAGFSDTARTVATKFANKFRESLQTGPNSFPGFQTVGDVTVDGGGNALFTFKWWNAKDAPQPSYSVNVLPVETNSLKNAGQSINNIKLGSSVGYAIVYMDKDGRKSAAYRVDGMTVAIDSINKLGGLKKPVVELTINHTPPEWAYSYQIVRTDDLVYGNYIQMLIQKTVAYSEGSDEYVDLVVGSLFTYQRIHPNTTLQYEFKRGDRVRIVSSYDGSDWIVPSVAKDFEVLAYFPSVEDVIDSDIEVDGSSSVKVSETSTDHIGSFIRVNGSEREIISVTDSTHYELSDTLSSGDPSNTTKTFPSYEIINRRGVIRIKNDPDNPIEADPDNDIFPLVEIFSPSVGNSSADEDMFAEFGLVLPIINPGTATAYHAGTTQDQDVSQPAIVEVSSGTSYVRYRELPVNNDIDNPQVLVGQVEDPSYSDFYVSDMNGNGKRIPLDRGDGEVLFDERIRFSNNYIEGTRINGLNDFDNLDRGDYNDKYGAIERFWYEEGRLYVFKHGKDTWLPIYAAIITDQGGNPLLAKSDKLLADKLQYYAWDGGVGDNPESVARLGTNFFHVSSNSMIVARIGGNGVDDISRIYSLDKAVRDHLTSAKKANAHIYGGTDRKNGKYDVIIEKHDNVISDTPISESGWINETEELPTSGVTYSLISGPSHGTANVSGSVIDYTPDNGYSGPDTMQYEVFVGGVSQGVRNVCLTVVYQEGPKAWRPIDPYCVMEEPSIPCGTSSSYSGGESFPTEEYVDLGDDTGTVMLNYDAITVPDKFTVEWDGNIVIDTGYRGDSGQQSALDSALAGKGLPPETIQGVGAGSATFNKTNSSNIAIVRVWAPMAGTAWSFTLTCPE